MITSIYEDGKMQEGSADILALMTPEQQRRGQYYQSEYLQRRAEVDSAYKTEWDYLQKLYECKRDPVADDPDFPNSFLPIITPTVEGQVASIVESEVDFRHVTNNPSHEPYMKMLDAASEYYRNRSRLKPHFKDFSRGYDLLGNAYVYISFDDGYGHSASEPNGCPRLCVPPLLSVLVDGRIKDSKDLQYADYIIQEIGYQSIGWARMKYGDEYANAISLLNNRQEGDNPDLTWDDTKTFMLLRVWTRDNEYGNLQMIEMDANGLILFESDPSKPYYKYVNNQYPFGLARMIPQLGRFYGVGDGAILVGMQELINNLADELQLAARFSSQARTFVDPAARMDGSQFTSNPADIILCKDPRNNVFTVQGQGINPLVLNMIELLFRESQKATRFNESMTGNTQGASATATQINTQMVQGSVGIKDKKNDIADVMAWADMYALKLCLEFWDRPFWTSLGVDANTWIDVQSIAEVPDSIPVTAKTVGEFEDAMPVFSRLFKGKKKRPSEPPRYETPTDDKGKNILTPLSFSTKVIIGESIPKGRTDMYNILLGLAQMQVMGADGQPRPLISADRVTQLMEDTLGFKLKTEKEDMLDSEVGEMMNTAGLNQMNPVGQTGAVQVPTAQNLQQTVPQMPNGDSRSVNI